MRPVSVNIFHAQKREILKDLSTNSISEEALSKKVSSLLKTAGQIPSVGANYAKGVNKALSDLGWACHRANHNELALKISDFLGVTSPKSKIDPTTGFFLEKEDLKGVGRKQARFLKVVAESQGRKVALELKGLMSQVSKDRGLPTEVEDRIRKLHKIHDGEEIPKYFKPSNLDLKKLNYSYISKELDGKPGEVSAEEILVRVLDEGLKLSTLRKETSEVVDIIGGFLPTEDGANLATASKDFTRIPSETASEVRITSEEGLSSFLQALKSSPGAGRGLISLNLSDRSISDEDLALIVEKCPKLQSLNLDSCSFVTNKTLETLKGFKNLQILDLRQCRRLTDAGLVHLKELTNLQSLNLSWCNKLTNAGLVHLKELTNLQSLNLTSCSQLTDVGLVHVKDLKNLLSLNLHLCKEITDAGLVHLKELVHLQGLGLSGCDRLTDAGLVHVKELTNLQSLSLSGCNRLTDAGLVHVKELTNLQSLSLSRCNQLTDAGLVHVKELKNLQRLGLSYCILISDVGLEHLKECKNLRALSLDWCKLITDTGLEHLKGLRNLQILDPDGCLQET